MNPIVEESARVYLRRKEYGFLHVAYIGALAAVTVLAWPSQGFMEFFRSGTVPAVFQVVTVVELLTLSAIGLYVGQDRLAASTIIRYSEWLERTELPVRTLFAGKLLSAALHTVLLVALGTPFLIIAAGPAGLPVRATLSAQWIILLVALLCRITGMLLCHLGEEHYFVRVVGPWVFLALLYLVTIGVLQTLNPVVALVRQYSEASALVSTVGPVPFLQHPALLPSVYLLGGSVIVAALFALGLARHRGRADRGSDHE